MRDQIQFETNGITMLAKKVPKDAIKIHLNPHPALNPDSLWIWYKVNTNTTGVPLPEGLWSIHSVTQDISEQALEFLLPETFKGRRYSHFCDILKSHGIDPAEKWVLLIKEK